MGRIPGGDRLVLHQDAYGKTHLAVGADVEDKLGRRLVERLALAHKVVLIHQSGFSGVGLEPGWSGRVHHRGPLLKGEITRPIGVARPMRSNIEYAAPAMRAMAALAAFS